MSTSHDDPAEGARQSFQDKNGGRILVRVNGVGTRTLPCSLAELLDGLGYRGQKIATAVNGDFVPERARAATQLAHGDRIEVVSARQGG